MKRDDLRSYLAASKVSMPARFVFLALTLHTNRNDEAWPSIGRLARETGSSIRTVQRALRELEAFGDVASVERTGCSTLYRITYNPGHCDTPATQSPLTDSHQPLSNSTRTPATVTPKGISKELGRSAPPPPDDAGALPDRGRNLAGVDAARAAKRAALGASRSRGQ